MISSHDSHHILRPAGAGPQASPESPQNAALDAPLHWEGRAILLVDLDAFFASVEQLDHPDWRGRPVIVGGSADRRGVVSTASYEARAFGVHSAMAAAAARRLCPDAIWTSGHYDRYREMSQAVMAIMRDESPFLQQVSIDEAFLDVTPGAFGTESPVEVARRIQKRVDELGVTCSVGLGASKTVAKVASEENKPHGITVVYPGRQQAFLAPLPIARMSGIGPASQKALHRFGITTLGDVAAADEGVLRQVFGKNAQMMRARCMGADTDPVVYEGEPAKSVSNEISFATDLTNRADIEAALATVAAKVGRRLRMNGLEASTVTLKVRLSNLAVRTAQQQLSEPCADEYVFAPVLYALLDKVWAPGTALRLVGMAASRFDGAAPQQASLFDDEGPASTADDATVQGRQRNRMAQEQVRAGLTKATDIVRDRFGEGAVQFGRELRTKGNLTGTTSKNPADYKNPR